MKKHVVFALLITLVWVVRAPASALPVELTVRAKALVTDLAEGRIDAVTAQLDARMRSALTADKLTQAWAQLQEQAGPFDSVGQARLTSAGQHSTVVVDCAFAKAHIDARIVYDRTGKVAGLRFVPHREALPEHVAVLPAGLTERTVTVGHAPWELPGTLTLPSGSGPFPAIVLIAGSGPVDRDETIGPNKVFRDLAWGLARRGIAVLRYDKRTNAHPVACAEQPSFTLDDETVDDARAAVRLLAHTEHVDHHEIFILGHSLGGMAAPRIAEGNPLIAGIVIMAGNVRPLQDLLLDQTLYLAGLDHELTPAEKQQIAQLRAARAQIDDPKLAATDTVTILGAKMPASYWLFFRRYHPDRVAAHLSIPMLILQGGRDFQVQRGDFELWRAALSGHDNVTFKLYPDLNHLFMPGQGPSSPEEYMHPGHVDSRVIEDIAAWILRHCVTAT